MSKSIPVYGMRPDGGCSRRDTEERGAALGIPQNL